MRQKKNNITGGLLTWFQGLCSKNRPKTAGDLILPMKEQVKAWRSASRIMGWEIADAEFDRLETLPLLRDEDRIHGFTGAVLFYGFGEDDSGNSDAVLSGQVAWEYACRLRKPKTWQCEYVNFNKPDDIRLRPGAPGRPRGFYWAILHPGERHMNMTVSQLRNKLGDNTGCGPEGFQLLAITHTHLADLMTAKKMPFMALADYDVAPYGFNDFYDAPQLFCSNHILGLGIGNVDRNYPLFGIPTLRFYD